MNAAGIHERWAGDHHEDAFLVTVNVDYKINKPQGVLFAIAGEAR